MLATLIFRIYSVYNAPFALRNADFYLPGRNQHPARQLDRIVRLRCGSKVVIASKTREKGALINQRNFVNFELVMGLHPRKNRHIYLTFTLLYYIT